MYLVYETLTKNRKRKNIVIKYPQESIHTKKEIIDYKLSLELSIKENIFTSQLNDEEIFEVIDILFQIEENQLNQIQIPKMLEKSSKRRIKNIAPIFAANIKEGINLFKTLAEINMPSFIVQSLSSAQRGGNIVKTYEDILEILELNLSTQNQISSMLRYPKMVFGAVVIYFFIIMYYIVPKSKELLETLQSDHIPEFSQMLYDASSYAMKNEISFTLYTLFIVFISYKVIYYFISKMIKFTPKLKNIPLYRDISLFYSILSTLMDSGIMLHSALRQSAEIINDNKLKADIIGVSKKMKKDGGSLYKYMKEDVKKLDEQVLTMMYQAEETGNFTRFFNRIQLKYSKEMKKAIDIGLELINPITMIFTVIVILGLYIGVNAPLFNIGFNSAPVG